MHLNFTKLTRLKKLLVLMILFVVAISCSKFDETPLELNKISFSTNKETNAVKDWYNKNHKRSNQNPFSTLKPIWDSMTKSFIDGRVVYEVKLENPEKVVSTINFISDSKYKRINDNTLEKVAKQSTLSLLFFENPKTAEIAGAAYMNLESTQGNINERWSYRNLKDFTGRVFYHSFFNGDLKDGYSYREGKIYQRASTLPLDGVKSLNELIKTNLRNNVLMSNKRSNSGSTYVCGSFFVEVYKHRCVQAGSGPLVCGYHYSGTSYVYLCDWFDNETTKDWIDGEPSGGGAPIAVFYDCNGDKDGTASEENECNICVGGNTGYTSCADVINNIKDPCLYTLAQQILNSNMNNEISNLIREVFANNNLTTNLYLTDASLPSHRDGETTLFTSTNNIIVVQIALNKNVLPSSSVEFIAATILHEAIHAYFDVTNTDINQHEEMAEKYILTMKNTLKSMFNGMSDEHALSLAWGGLENTTHYTNPPTGLTIPVNQSTINGNYRNKTLGNGCF